MRRRSANVHRARTAAASAPVASPRAAAPMLFLVLAFGLSWTPWVTLVLTTGDPFAGPGSLTLFVIGGYGPTAAALIAAARTGRGGLRRLWSDARRWRLGAWYLGLLLPLLAAAIAVGLVVGSGRAALEAPALSHWLLLPAILASGVLLGGFEEVGWRGYLLPCLQDRIDALTASVAIGLVWAVWHAPLFFMESVSQASFSPWWFTLHAVALSVLFTWMYNGTRGSLLLVVLFHGAVNGWYDWSVAFAPDALPHFLAPAGLTYVLVAVVVAARYGADRLASRPRRGWRTDTA